MLSTVFPATLTRKSYNYDEWVFRKSHPIALPRVGKQTSVKWKQIETFLIKLGQSDFIDAYAMMTDGFYFRYFRGKVIKRNQLIRETNLTQLSETKAIISFFDFNENNSSC